MFIPRRASENKFLSHKAKLSIIQRNDPNLFTYHDHLSTFKTPVAFVTLWAGKQFAICLAQQTKTSEQSQTTLTNFASHCAFVNNNKFQEEQLTWMSLLRLWPGKECNTSQLWKPILCAWRFFPPPPFWSSTKTDFFGCTQNLCVVFPKHPLNKSRNQNWRTSGKWMSLKIYLALQSWQVHCLRWIMLFLWTNNSFNNHESYF